MTYWVFVSKGQAYWISKYFASAVLYDICACETVITHKSENRTLEVSLFRVNEFVKFGEFNETGWIDRQH